MVLFSLFSFFWALLQPSVSRCCSILSSSSSVIFCNPQTISEFLGYISGLDAGTLIMAWPVLSKSILIVELHHGFCTYPLFLFTTSFFLLQFAETHFSCLRFAVNDAILCIHDHTSDFPRPLIVDCSPQINSPLCGHCIASLQVIYESF